MDGLFSGLMTLLIFILGASVGSFLNVVIYRIPAGLSLLHPPSRCPHCLHRLQPHDNVPVLGWLWLKGRCRYCRTAIAPRYPMVEATTGILFVLVFWSFAQASGLALTTGSLLQTVSSWAFVSWLLALALIDLDTLTLPNSLTQSGLVVGLVFQALLGWATGADWVGVAHSLMTGILGAVVGIWVFDLITILGSVAFGQTAMGGGDAKLAAMMGAWLGWKLLLLAGFLACAIGAFAGGGAIAVGLLNRRQPMPFGPFLALGAIVSAFLGEKILSIYVQLFFPTL
ncbi:MAG: prepilin peptidase [Oculatellaceae cyanobacterium Prado106]|jgi:leader peptidase (prepilin peptidase)/N-methyltransferase|nr:prepilin peptidase [Oculatellaceae cyanobacterium Prado106]